MNFPDGSKNSSDLLFPHDGSYFDMLSPFVETETVDPADMDWRGMMAAIGIQKGKPFQPAAPQRRMLDLAAKAAFNMIKVEIWDGLLTQPGGKYYPDRQWENVFAGQNPLFQSSGTFTNLVQRDAYFTSAYTTSPAMVVDMLEKGAKYPAVGQAHARRRRLLRHLLRPHLPRRQRAQLASDSRGQGLFRHFQTLQSRKGLL
jgi:hypothetical protein